MHYLPYWTKKEGTICWVFDLSELNQVIQCCIQPLPHINDTFEHHPGYSYFTKLELSMQYLTFESGKDSKALCVISTPLILLFSRGFESVSGNHLILHRRSWKISFKILGFWFDYREMWPCCFHILAPSEKSYWECTFLWTADFQEAFNAMKAMMFYDVLLCYPDHNLLFTICTNASDYKLGSVILQ